MVGIKSYSLLSWSGQSSLPILPKTRKIAHPQQRAHRGHTRATNVRSAGPQPDCAPTLVRGAGPARLCPSPTLWPAPRADHFTDPDRRTAGAARQPANKRNAGDNQSAVRVFPGQPPEIPRQQREPHQIKRPHHHLERSGEKAGANGCSTCCTRSIALPSSPAMAVAFAEIPAAQHRQRDKHAAALQQHSRQVSRRAMPHIGGHKNRFPSRQQAGALRLRRRRRHRGRPGAARPGWIRRQNRVSPPPR